MERIPAVGKKALPAGKPPAVALINPKYLHNVGQAIRACSCFGISQVWYTGNRVQLDNSQRLPREMRMKSYAEVELVQFDYIFDQFPTTTPVAVEITPTSEIMTTFNHPERPLYIFGPEDGNIPKVTMQHCHRFVTIPVRHCTNLAAAVYLTLYDRHIKRQLAGLEPILPASEVSAEIKDWASFNN